jgi:hypothetical protein
VFIKATPATLFPPYTLDSLYTLSPMPQKRTAVQLILLVALLQLFIALLSSTLTFTLEESMWHYVGRNWFRHGLVPYTGGVDNKWPLIFSVFGLSDWLFGVNYWFPRILGTAVESIGIYYVYKIARRLAGERAGIMAISVYGLSLLWKTTGGKLVSFTETYSTTLVIISFYKCLTAEKNKSLFIGGLLAGLGFGFRISAIFGIMAIFLMMLRKKISSSFLFVAGLITSIGLLLLFLELAGIKTVDIFYYGFTDNFGKGSTTDHNFHWKLENFFSNFFYSELVLFYPFTVGYIFIKKRIDPLITWLILAFIGINLLGLYARPHFKELLPALSLTSAIAITHLTETYKVPFRSLLVIVWVCFFPKTLEPFWAIKKIVRPPADTPDAYCRQYPQQVDEDAEKKLGLWLKSVTKKTDLIYVAGYGARVQVFSERRSPALYFNVTQNENAKKTIMHDLQTSPPALVVVPAFGNYKDFVHQDLRDFLDQFVARNYAVEKCMYGYTIYRLK